MAEDTTKEAHEAHMRGVLLHKRSNLCQERLLLTQAPKRIAAIDAELALVDADLTAYGWTDPEKQTAEAATDGAE